MQSKKWADRVLGLLFIATIFTFFALNLGNITKLWSTVFGKSNFQSAIETEYTENFSGHDAFVDLDGWAARITGRRVLNERMLLKNGTLVSIYQTAEESAVTNSTDTLVQTAEYLAGREIPFLFVYAPYKCDEDSSLLPSPIEMNLQERGEEIIANLKQAGIAYLSLNEEMQADGLPYYDAYFRTDHHWKPETALWACGKTLETLRARFGLTLNPTDDDPALWQTETFPDSFLGSDGKRVGVYFAGLDDFSLLTPDWATSLQCWWQERGLYRTGDFAAALLERSHIGEAHTTNAYDAYLDGGGGMQYVQNLSNADGPRILLIGDSYSQPYFAFLAVSCSQCVRLDMRYYKASTLYDFLEQNDFDCVISLFNGVYVNHGAMPLVPQREATSVVAEQSAVTLAAGERRVLAADLSPGTDYRLTLRGTHCEDMQAPWCTALLTATGSETALASEALMTNCGIAQVWTFRTDSAGTLSLQGAENASVTLDSVTLERY
ncbi:MAG: hypothetical protein PHY64_13280 [Eubacteriales bacterium]|nr:hypothetical protein [Eubacteriales bacterium]